MALYARRDRVAGTTSDSVEEGALEYDASNRPGDLGLAIHVATADRTEGFALVPCCGSGRVDVSFRQPTTLAARPANAARHGVVFSATSDFDHAFVDYTDATGRSGGTHGITYRGGSVTEATVMDDIDLFPVSAAWVGVMDIDGREPWEDGAAVRSVRRLVLF